jgi:serine/threonine protein kinase
MEPLTRDDPGEVAGYRLRARLGTGGMGRVYLAFTPGGRPVAVKVMRAELGDDRDFRDRFRQEVEAAARVQGLYTAQVIDADPMAVPPWMVTAYVPGPSLQQAVRDHGPMPARTVFQLMAGVAEALQAIHSAGVVHRDLKPSNVLLAPDGPRVIDFGIARAADATALTRTGMRVGSPQFMAPEQIAGHPATPATDIFGLGALAAYAALGRAPFGNADAEAVSYRILHQDPDLEGCPEPLRTVISRCLAKEPAYRPQPREIIPFCGAGLASSAPESAQSWLPPGMAAELAYHSALMSTLPTATAAPTATAVPTATAAPGGAWPGPTAVAPPSFTGPGPSQLSPVIQMPGPHPPSSIVNAVRLMYAGAASAVVNAIVGAAAVYSVVHHILAKEPGANQNTVNSVTAIDVALTIFYGLAGIALWLWMAHANRNGQSWARILSTVLFAVLTLSLPFAFIQVPYVLPWITSIAQWALAVAALVLLWVGPSSAYFAAMRRPAGSPPGTAWHGPQRPDNAGVQRDPGAFGPLREPGNW